MEIQDILNELGSSLDLELTLDEQGQCLIIMDEHLMVSLRAMDDALIMYGMLGKIDQLVQFKNVGQTLLALNLSLAESGAGSVVLEPSSKVIMLVKRIATDHMDGQRMQNVLGNFVDALENIMTEFGPLQESMEEPPLPAFPQGLEMMERA